MKTSRMFLATSLFAGVLLTTAYAQSTIQVKASVPFDFKAGQTRLAAGNYAVSTTADGVLRIQDQKGACALVLTHSAGGGQISEQSKLVFHRYGDQYFLQQVWQSGNSYSAALSPSRDERMLERSGARPAVSMVIGQAR